MTNAVLKSVAIAASTVILLGVGPAHAGADAVRAEAYFNAISGGNAETIASFYADDAEFHWVGGPLAGVYKGKDKIKAVWDKFSKAAGDLDYEVQQLSESTNGKLSTVTARVKFKGEGEVPVKFIMMYRDGKIASEVWQVDKPGVTYAKAEPKAAALASPDAKAGTPVPPAAKPAPSAGAPRDVATSAKVSDPQAEKLDGPGAENLPEGAGGPQANAAASAPSPAAAPEKSAEIAPETGLKAEPKPGGEPQLKAPAEKKASGYSQKNEAAGNEKKVSKPKKPHYEGYAYDGYGSGGYGGYGGYSGWGRGGYGRY